jgi:hypothetical protein
MPSHFSAEAIPTPWHSSFRAPLLHIPVFLSEITDYQILSGCAVNVTNPRYEKQISVTLCADLTSETLQTAASALSMSLRRVEFVIELLGLVVSAKRIVLKFGYTQLPTA